MGREALKLVMVILTILNSMFILFYHKNPYHLMISRSYLVIVFWVKVSDRIIMLTNESLPSRKNLYILIELLSKNCKKMI